MTEEPGLARTAARGSIVTLASQGAKIVLQLLSIVILARLLSPHDYGLLAIVLVVVGAGEVFRDFGLTPATIQAKSVSDAQRTNLFWWSTGIGAVLAIAMFALAEPVANLTENPELVGLIRALSVLFVLNGLITQHRAQLMRGLRFRALAAIDVTAALLALIVAIGAASAGAEYWALAVQQVVTGLVTLIGALWVGRWMPGRYQRSAPMRTFLRLGSSLAGSSGIQYVGSQVDTAILSLQFGTVPLGLYNRAYQIVMTPLGQIRSPLQGVALPVLSRVQDDQPRFDRYLRAAQCALGCGLGLPLAVLAGLSQPAVILLLGEEWSSAGILLGMFAITGLLTTVSFVGYWVYVARGLGRELMRYTLVTTGIKIVAVVVGSTFGVTGVAVGLAIHPMIAWPLSLFWLSKVTPIPVRSLAQGASRIIGLCAVAGGSAYVTTTLVTGSALWQVGAGIAVAAVAVGATTVLPAVRRDLAMVFAMGRLAAQRRASVA